MSQLRRTNLSQAVLEELLRRLREGELRPGDRLPPERELMARFDVGRNTLREALHVLSARGVLDARPGRGTFVQSVSADDVLDGPTLSALFDKQAIRDVYEFRLQTEVAMAVLAAERRRPEDLDGIKAALDQFAAAVASDAPAYEADLEFHQALAHASHNFVYPRVLSALDDILAFVRRATDRSTDARIGAVKAHNAIYEAVLRQDCERAGAAMTKHINAAIIAVERLRLRFSRSS